MAIDPINTTDVQEEETNVNWYDDGERANAAVLNRPVKEVSGKVNETISQVNENTQGIVDLHTALDESSKQLKSSAIAMAIALG